jgi:hypothetical protein
VASKSLGYGTYRFTVDSNLDGLAPNLVLGLFTWDDTSADSFHREMDVELGRWGRADNEDAQFVVQPYSVPGNITRFGLPRGLNGSVFSFRWSPGGVSFRAEGITPSRRTFIKEHQFEHMIPEPANEQARINLWCTDSKPPEGVAEVVITNFEFEMPR